MGMAEKTERQMTASCQGKSSSSLDCDLNLRCRTIVRNILSVRY